MKYNFNSDTTANVCPEVFQKITEIFNEGGYELGYSQDKYSNEVRRIMQNYFTKPIQCHFNASGSGANVLAIKVMKQNFSSIICCNDTHINRYEVGGTEYNTGCKIIACDSKDAKLTVPMIEHKLQNKGSFNYSLPTIVVLSEVTELGTCYTCEELKAICDFCHKNNIYVYMDGARLSNAMAYLKVGFKEILEDTGVDIASFGGNKNGAMFGEMIILLNEKFFDNFILHQKQSMQLFSKTRFLGGQFLAMLENEAWRKNALHSNQMAIYFAEQIAKLGVTLAMPVQSNAIFVNFTEEQIKYLQKEYKMGSYDTDQPFCRLMTSWSTSKEEIDEFIEYFSTFFNKK